MILKHFLRRHRLVNLFSPVSFLFLVSCQLRLAPAAKLLPLILFSLDGFRHDYTDKTDSRTSDRLAKEGIRAEGLIPAFPSKTYPNHYTIVTELYREHQGLVPNRMYDPKFDAWYRIGQGSKAVTEGRWYGGEPISDGF